MKKLFASFTSALAIFAFSLPFGTTVKSAEFLQLVLGEQLEFISKLVTLFVKWLQSFNLLITAEKR